MIYTVIRKIAYKKNKMIKEIEIAKKLPNGIIGKWDTSMPQADKLQAVMIQRMAKGKQAREYFVEVEKQFDDNTNKSRLVLRKGYFFLGLFLHWYVKISK